MAQRLSTAGRETAGRCAGRPTVDGPRWARVGGRRRRPGPTSGGHGERRPPVSGRVAAEAGDRLLPPVGTGRRQPRAGSVLPRASLGNPPRVARRRGRAAGELGLGPVPSVCGPRARVGSRQFAAAEPGAQEAGQAGGAHDRAGLAAVVMGWSRPWASTIQCNRPCTTPSAGWPSSGWPASEPGTRCRPRPWSTTSTCGWRASRRSGGPTRPASSTPRPRRCGGCWSTTPGPSGGSSGAGITSGCR